MLLSHYTGQLAGNTSRWITRCWIRMNKIMRFFALPTCYVGRVCLKDNIASNICVRPEDSKCTRSSCAKIFETARSSTESPFSTVEGKKFATQPKSNILRLHARYRILRVACDNPVPRTLNVEKQAHELALRNLRGSRNPSFEHTIANNIELGG